LDVSGCSELIYLSCGYYNYYGDPPGNFLTYLDVSKNRKLKILECANNKLSDLDISNNTSLKMLDCCNNQLTGLDVSKNKALLWLHCKDNQMTTLDISENTELEFLDCSNNQIALLEVSGCTNLDWLDCSGNQLRNLNVSTNQNIYRLGIENMETLYEVCAWITPFPFASTSGSPNVCFQTDCNGDCNIEPIGMEEESWSSEIKIYPNPTGDLLHVDSEHPGYHSITITTMNGQLLYSSEKKSNNLEIDLSSFQKGIYFITIRSEQFVTTRKLVKLE
jgi:hypothetical protein